jgi:hypothetical protein
MRGRLERDRQTIEIATALAVFVLVFVAGWLVLGGIAVLVDERRAPTVLGYTAFTIAVVVALRFLYRRR